MKKLNNSIRINSKKNLMEYFKISKKFKKKKFRHKNKQHCKLKILANNKKKQHLLKRKFIQ